MAQGSLGVRWRGVKSALSSCSQRSKGESYEFTVRSYAAMAFATVVVEIPSEDLAEGGLVELLRVGEFLPRRRMHAGPQVGDDIVPGVGHLDRIHNRAERLLLEQLDSAVPEEVAQVRGLVDRGGVSPALGAVASG